MEVSNTPAVSEENAKAAKLTALLDKVMPFARAADAVARRLVGKVAVLSLLGLAAGAWTTFACAQRFELSAVAVLPIAAFVLAAPLVLLKLAIMLRTLVGLPQRIANTGSRIIGKAQEYRELAAGRAQSEPSKPTLRSLWNNGRSLAEIRGLTGESKEIAALAGKALVISNPLFAILLAVTCILTVILILIAIGIAAAS